MELISDGNLTLMWAVDGFDVHRGNKFSTYATLALMKGFARSVPAMMAGSKAASADEGLLEGVADHREHGEKDRVADRELVKVLLSTLNAKERGVIAARFGLEASSSSGGSDEGARGAGLSRYRMGQIEKAAIAKLKRAAVGN